MKTSLSVNLNKVALLRSQRQQGAPKFLDVARIALQTGPMASLCIPDRTNGMRHLMMFASFEV